MLLTAGPCKIVFLVDIFGGGGGFFLLFLFLS
jgi:hypothetical protein